jgi:hypothetical protein
MSCQGHGQGQGNRSVMVTVTVKGPVNEVVGAGQGNRSVTLISSSFLLFKCDSRCPRIGALDLCLLCCMSTRFMFVMFVMLLKE